MSIRTRIGKLEKAAPIDAESLRPEFIRDSSGKVVAAELPLLGLSRVNRLEGETEPEFQQRVHLDLVKAHSGHVGPFYELLDNPTLEACRGALEAYIAAHDPNLLAKLKENGDLNV